MNLSQQKKCGFQTFIIHIKNILKRFNILLYINLEKFDFFNVYTI